MTCWPYIPSPTEGRRMARRGIDVECSKWLLRSTFPVVLTFWGFVVSARRPAEKTFHVTWRNQRSSVGCWNLFPANSVQVGLATRAPFPFHLLRIWVPPPLKKKVCILGFLNSRKHCEEFFRKIPWTLTSCSTHCWWRLRVPRWHKRLEAFFLMQAGWRRSAHYAIKSD